MTALDDAPTTTTLAGKREWLGLVALACPTFIVAIDLFVLLLALPNMATDLHANTNQQLWITDIYGFVLAGFMVTMGNLADRIGRRKLLLIGSAAFGVGSVLCAYSTSPEMLIAVRALLGVAGATLMPSAMALVSTLFRDPKQMATAYGIFAGTFTLGAVFGPVIGGFMLGHFWWGSVFLLGVPIMVLLLIIGPKLLPEAKNPNAGPIDLTSVALWLLAVLPVIYGIKQLARYGWQVLPVVSLVLGLGFGWVFLRRQRILEHPLLDLKLLRDRTIGVCLTGAVFNTMIGGGFMLTMMLYFQLVVGLSTLQAGLAMMPALLIGTLGFQIAPKLASRYKPAYVIAIGLVISAGAMAAMTQFNPSSGATPLIVGFAVMGFFGAPMPGLGTNLILASAPPERAGAAGSLAQLGNEFGNVLGFAIYGTIGAAVYRATLQLPGNTPPAVAAAAHDSLAGAAAATANLPHDVAAAVLGPAHQAFANGLHVVTGTATIVMLALAVLVATKLRHVQPFGHPAPAVAAAE